MRMRLDLPDDVHNLIASFAEAMRISFGEALAQLVRKGLRCEPPKADEGGFPHFPVQCGADRRTGSRRHMMEWWEHWIAV